MSKHTLEYGTRARQFDTSDFQDESVTRIIKKLSVLERAALPEDELKEVSGKGTEKQRVSTAIILCEDTNCSQNLRNATGQPPSVLKKVIAWYLLHKAKILVFSFPPKGCLSQACLGDNSTLLVGPRPSYIDSTLPPLGSH